MPIAPIQPRPDRGDPPVIADYAAARGAFRWESVASDLSIDPAAMNLGELATSAQVAQGRGNSKALTWFGAEGVDETYTYQDLTDHSARAANLLQKLGVQRGDRVLFLLPNSPALYFGVLGALRAGACVGVLGGVRSIEALRSILTSAKPRVFVTVPSFRSPIVSLRAEVKELEWILFSHRPSVLPPMLDEREGVWNQLFEEAEPTFVKGPTTAADRALLHFSDLGTSGAVSAHRIALPLISSSRDVLEIRPGETTLTVAMPGEPVFLSYTLLAPFLIGARLVAIEDPARFQKYMDIAVTDKPKVWFSSQKALDVIIRTDPNLGLLLKNCRNICMTYPYETSFVVMTSESFGTPVHACWWDREFGVIQTAELRGSPNKPGSVGRPVPGAEVRIIDEAGNPLPAGQKGTLAVKLGPGCPFVEFWDDPGLTHTQVRDGWFVTTHSAHIDDDGYVWIAS